MPPDRTDSQIETLIYHISHDVAAPVRQIKSLIDLLKDSLDLEADSEAGTYLSYLTTQSELALQMLNALAQLSRIDAAALEPQSVTLQEMLEPVRAQFPQLQIDTDASSQQAFVADAAFFGILLEQLAQNVATYAQTDQLSLRLNQSDQALVLTVQDGGIGLSTDEWQRFLMPFARHTGRAELGQLGMGLPLIQNICVAHGWRLQHQPSQHGLHINIIMQVIAA